MGIEWWLVPVIAGILAIVGGWLGTHWGGRVEHRQWLRNEKLRVYAEFLEAADIVGKDRTKLFSTLQKVLLIAPEEVFQRGIALQKYVGKVDELRRMARTEPALMTAEFERAMEDAVAVLHRLTYEMRLDLNPRTKREYDEFMTGSRKAEAVRNKQRAESSGAREPS